MNRRIDHKKYGPTKKERKPNETKEGLLREMYNFLAESCEIYVENDPFCCENVEILNKNRLIHFDCNGKEYDLQLIEKRLPKKA